MRTVINQRIVLAKRPVGEPKHSDFRIEQVELNELKQGEILLKTIYLSLDPYMRGRMSDASIFDDYGSQYPEFNQQMSEWLKDGKIKYKEHVVQGLDNTINAFSGMLKGENFGKVLVKI